MDPQLRMSNPDCPKQMVYGPCGGVTPSGGCEVDDRRCPFVDLRAALDWPVGSNVPGDNGVSVAPPEAPGSSADWNSGVVAWVDFRPDPSLRWEVAQAAELLSHAGAGVLIGEHLDDPTPHEPHRVAAPVTACGLPTVSTVTCRNRTDEDIDDAVEALMGVGVSAVHCVTGDHPAARLGLADRPRFHRDGTELAGRAAALGATVSVAESPASPPTGLRVGRLRTKQDAGARIAFLNHAGGPGSITGFARRCRDQGVTMDLIAPVPVVTDRRSASALERFPGLELPPGLLDRILRASDPGRVGIEEAVRLGHELLESGEFAGLNLSGRGNDSGLVARAELMAHVAERMTR